MLTSIFSLLPFILLPFFQDAVNPFDHEGEAQHINGNEPLVMRTTNGCWDVDFLIINRGNMSAGIYPTVGFFDYQSSAPVYHPSDTLPMGDLLDCALPSSGYQDGINAQSLRYFTISTPAYTYLYSIYPVTEGFPEIIRMDSIVTPANFITSSIIDLEYILLVSKDTSASKYNYSFYTLPDFDLDTQIVLKIKPERIDADYSNFLIAGDSAGTSKLIRIYTYNGLFQIVYNISLPAEASKVFAISQSIYNYFLLSSPTDSTSYLIQIDKSDTTINSIPLPVNSGIRAASKYQEFDFIFQPVSDSVLENELVILSSTTGVLSDTLWLHHKISSIHYNPAFGFGFEPYELIMGTDDSASNDWVFFRMPYASEFDSLLADERPMWFGEDFRCYVAVQEVEHHLSIDIFPNPASDYIQLVINHLGAGKAYPFTITDTQGKILWKQDIYAKKEYTIPFNDFPKGVLILNINTGDKIISRKVIKD